MEAYGCRFRCDGKHYCWPVADPMVADNEVWRGYCSSVDDETLRRGCSHQV
ncbi:hypothetical protein DEO72_LG9g1208 [Vigna unguiculata]|uniref:Uncharacterized protein n=1 Tax=Vigna unguiculata TaxID=3917 RepID=A0A4D6N2I0_VIGUN|nr:hypothetical protein DEO72_LG9g1208 [Vigna unguiculata]